MFFLSTCWLGFFHLPTRVCRISPVILHFCHVLRFCVLLLIVVRYEFALASESSNIDHVTPSACNATPIQSDSSLAPCRTPPLSYASPTWLCTCPARACYPKSSQDRHFPFSQPSRSTRRTPNPTVETHRSPPSCRPTSKAQDTAALLRIALVAHRPWSIAPRGLDPSQF